MQDGSKGLRGQLKGGREGEKKVRTQTYEQLWQRGTRNDQDSALRKSKGERGDSQVFDPRGNKVGSGAHNEDWSLERAVGVIQVTDNKRHESGRCHKKGEETQESLPR